MKQEFGKWFLDVAKYMLTAMLLSRIGKLGIVKEKEIIMGAITALVFIAVTGIGLLIYFHVTDKQTQGTTL